MSGWEQLGRSFETAKRLDTLSRRMTPGALAGATESSSPPTPVPTSAVPGKATADGDFWHTDKDTGPLPGTLSVGPVAPPSPLVDDVWIDTGAAAGGGGISSLLTVRATSNVNYYNGGFAHNQVVFDGPAAESFGSDAEWGGAGFPDMVIINTAGLYLVTAVVAVVGPADSTGSLRVHVRDWVAPADIAHGSTYIGGEDTWVPCATAIVQLPADHELSLLFSHDARIAGVQTDLGDAENGQTYLTLAKVG